MANPRIQFRPEQELRDHLQARLEHIPEDEDLLGAILKQRLLKDVDRYYKALPPTLYDINLSYGEAMVIVDALNGYLMTPELPQLMRGSVEYVINYEEGARKWNVDGPALIQKMSTWTPIDCLAVTDAVERWWMAPTYYTDEETETFEQRCIRVGLIRTPRKTLSPTNNIEK